MLEHGEKFLSCGASGLLTFTVFWTHATTHFCSPLLALFEQQVAAAPLVWGFRREWIYLGKPPCFVSSTGVSFCWEPGGLALLVCAGSAGEAAGLSQAGQCWGMLNSSELCLSSLGMWLCVKKNKNSLLGTSHSQHLSCLCLSLIHQTELGELTSWQNGF